MAEPTVEAELAGVQGVTVGHGLARLVADVGVLGREVVPGEGRGQDAGGRGGGDAEQRGAVRPAGEDLRH